MCSAALWSRSFCNMTILTFNFWETKISNQIQREEIDSFTYYLWRNGITYAIARKFFLGNIWSDDAWKWIWSTSIVLSLLTFGVIILQLSFFFHFLGRKINLWQSANINYHVPAYLAWRGYDSNICIFTLRKLHALR